eukprot:gb/GECG01014103.1/.p1 GENE.gb/GECG01014103.1/~~gb/GECG01014103.1/.p1  ORF type:complete len:283 (+),score=35.73 gb/GECG01014103.1/:1-849(+)
MHKIYERPSYDETWKPHVRPIRIDRVETPKSGKKHIQPPQEFLTEEQKTQDPLKPHKRHISNEELSTRLANRQQENKPTDLLPRRGQPHDDKGNLIRDIYRGEQSLDSLLQRKRKIDPADIDTIRNGIGFAKPGDNQVCSIEYHPGFYKTPGNIPGSTWGNFKPLPNFFKTEWARKSRMDAQRGRKVKGFGEGPSLPRVPMSYREMTVYEKRRAQEIAAEVQEIKNLNPTSTKAVDDTWESRTGNLTVSKEQPTESPIPPSTEEGSSKSKEGDKGKKKGKKK